MAFSYSDENFTVIGNLCFVHILYKGTDLNFAIPPAIRDRMLVDNFYCIYLGFDSENSGFANAYINNGNIHCTAFHDNGYINFYFPIDSNK